MPISSTLTPQGQYSSAAAKDVLNKMQLLQAQRRRQRRTIQSKEYIDFVGKNIKNVRRTEATRKPYAAAEVNKLDVQRKLLAPEELYCFWDKEFDRQMRKAALLDEEQWHAQRTLHDM